jgi:hypothetical protein
MLELKGASEDDVLSWEQVCKMDLNPWSENLPEAALPE